jgi:UDP-galactose transporter B1
MAMLFIPYPFYMCVSTAKFLPVLLMGWLVNGRTPTPAAALASALMLQGILLYSSETLSKTALVRSEEDPVVLFGVPLSPAFTVVAGVSVTLINLTMEGWTNASQDALRKRAGPEFKNYEFYLMAVMNAWSFVLLTVFLAVECALRGPASLLLTAISFAGRHPRILADIGAFAALGALAQIFIFTSISEHGSFSTTTITVSRKFLSVLVSVALFGHKLSFPQWVGVADVFAGLGTQMLYGSHGHGHGGEGKKVHKGLKTA